ncbi:hypothetical protein [Bradyrhizobium australafricanum]|uniref:hypothetical protein n=1 Tax=Bradyrhizobium australafricanum TaxID=2821406 RepID=UPI001CE28E78|nr:hypothetical protein [Bradyrhizobium australafricanum]MCA6097627.1 hypothetical protein [Bradyrhizobium australafricanum]
MDNEFNKQRAILIRDLAERADDPFIKRRLLALAARYEGPVTANAVTPMSIGGQRASGNERG